MVHNNSTFYSNIIYYLLVIDEKNIFSHETHAYHVNIFLNNTKTSNIYGSLVDFDKYFLFFNGDSSDDNHRDLSYKNLENFLHLFS